MSFSFAPLFDCPYLDQIFLWFYFYPLILFQAIRDEIHGLPKASQLALAPLAEKLNSVGGGGGGGGDGATSGAARPKTAPGAATSKPAPTTAAAAPGAKATSAGGTLSRNTSATALPAAVRKNQKNPFFLSLFLISIGSCCKGYIFVVVTIVVL
jgi:hypothetical protein